jgi:hypothetical protein
MERIIKILNNLRTLRVFRPYREVKTYPIGVFLGQSPQSFCFYT